MPQWLCATPRIADAVEELSAKRRELLAAKLPAGKMPHE
jgi:hypothetical protein